MVYFLIALILILLYLVISFLMAYGSLHLDRQPVPKNPADYGMPYQNIVLKPADGLKIKGWLIPGNTQKIVIMTHVGGLNKYGSPANHISLFKFYYKEIEFLKTAKHLHDAGYNVLMFDFRNHGESDSSPNNGVSGVGIEEYRDVIAALDFVRSQDELKNMEIGFVSFCMGANSTIVAMSKEPAKFDNVKCLMAIQPLSIPLFSRMLARRLFSPIGEKLFLPMVKVFIKLLSNYKFEDRYIEPYISGVKIPTLYVQATHDIWTELSEIQGFYDHTNAPKELFWITDTKRRFDTYRYFQDRPERMLSWLSKWM